MDLYIRGKLVGSPPWGSLANEITDELTERFGSPEENESGSRKWSLPTEVRDLLRVYDSQPDFSIPVFALFLLDDLVRKKPFHYKGVEGYRALRLLYAVYAPGGRRSAYGLVSSAPFSMGGAMVSTDAPFIIESCEIIYDGRCLILKAPSVYKGRLIGRGGSNVREMSRMLGIPVQVK